MEDLKNIKDNPYGLSRIIKRDTSSNIIEEQVTPFDSFISEDALRYFINKSELENIKGSISDRLDSKTGLYEITLADKDPRYYDFATMFNRLTNSVYAKKVYKQVKLLGEYAKLIRSEYSKSINNAISNITSVDTMDYYDNKKTK